MKTISPIILFITAALSSFGEGSILFQNSSLTRVFVETSPGTTTYVPGGSQFTAELMFAPDSTPRDLFDSVAVRVGVTTFSAPGFFSGGQVRVASITPPGGFGLFQVRVWETAGGSDYRATVATGDPDFRAGASDVLRADTDVYILLSVESAVPRNLVEAGLKSFTVTAVPEPSVIALAVLSTGVLLLLHRNTKPPV